MSGISDRTYVSGVGGHWESIDLTWVFPSFAQLSPHPRENILFFAMPPKNAPSPSLTTAEEMLLIVAARINTGIRYMEANPGEDDGHFMRYIMEELVSSTLFI